MERAEENKKAKEMSRQMELPDLSGSPKQVEWANTLRIQFIEKYERVLETFRKEGKEKTYLQDHEGFRVIATEQQLMEFRDWILEHKTDAKFYIENRNAYPIFYIKEAVEGLEKEKNAIPEEIQSEIDAEDAALTVQPKNKTKDGVVQIVLDDNVIRVKYILDENFR
ncbi:MAG TPA: hypothetical protein IAA06_00590, partial [Candidatus Blautia faecavium]|nr:hypothetical protein [Candidatus Blautia faecavium]